MYIGGLLVDKLPCDCGAPFAETGVTESGSVGCALHVVAFGKTKEIFRTRTPKSWDCLEMHCTRCGADACNPPLPKDWKGLKVKEL